MGVNLTPIVTAQPLALEALRGRKVAVDGHGELYQFLALIRLPDGTPLRDRHGRITSHLSVLFFRTTRLIAEHGLEPAFVFDGAPPALKAAEIEKRRAVKARYDAEAASGWDCVIGLHLTAEGDAAETLFGLYVRGGTAELKEGSLPDNPALVIRAGAGTWAAILLKKKRIEMALIQGKLKAEGKAEEGLKLRSVFHL